VAESLCMRALQDRAAKAPAAHRVEVEISRSYLGAADKAERYLIVTIPPQG
jgi:hypothetical protein